MSDYLDTLSVRRITLKLLVAAVTSGSLMAIAASSGFLRWLYSPMIGPLVGLGIAIPVIVYFSSSALKSYFRTVGLHPITERWKRPSFPRCSGETTPRPRSTGSPPSRRTRRGLAVSTSASSWVRTSQQ